MLAGNYQQFSGNVPPFTKPSFPTSVSELKSSSLEGTMVLKRIQKAQVFWFVLPMVVIGAATILSFVSLMPPSASNRNVPLSEFSAERAMDHIRVQAQRPRPTGSTSQQTAAKYLLDTLTDFGIGAELQENASVQNVVARLSGTDSSGAIVLMAHYDSTETSPGTADNASGTAVILETVRALKRNAPLLNDVIVLFTDSEERGLRGAVAFVNQHPWMSEVKVVLNFDTFTVGPAVLWQMSPENGWLVQAVAQSGANPVVAPYLFSNQSTLPYRTDLIPFLDRGVSGYNFWTVYAAAELHTPEDQVDIVTEESLQSAGKQALILTRYLGQTDLISTKGPDETYFNLGPWFVHYPARWNSFSTMGIGFVCAGILVFRLHQYQLVLRKLIIGCLILGSSTVLVSLLTLAVWQVIHHHAFKSLFLHMKLDLELMGTAYTWKHVTNDAYYFIAFESAAFFCGLLVYLGIRKKQGLSHAVGSVLVAWIVLLILSSFTMTDVSYMFVAPTASSVLLLTASLAPLPVRYTWRSLALLAVIPAILLWFPAIYLFYQGTALGYLATLVPVTMLLTWTLLLYFDLSTTTEITPGESQ